MGPGHADKWETSITLALEGAHVRIDELPKAGEPLSYTRFGIVDGRAFDGQPTSGFVVPEASDPRYSAAAEGEHDLEEAVATIAEEVRQALRG